MGRTLQMALYDSEDENDDLREQLRQCKKVLKKVEWVYDGDYADKLCPLCREYDDYGHASDCELNRAILGGSK